MTPTGCILLAAGASRRFGSAKLLHPMAGGRPLIQHTLQALAESGLPVMVVHKANDTDLLNAIAPFDVATVANPRAQQGMGTSIASAVAATPQWQGWLICLADMPFIKAQTYQQVAAQLQQHPMVVPYLGESSNAKKQLGHPRGFQPCFRQSLLELSGDQGPKQLIRSSENTFYLKVDDPGIVHDVDHPGDI